MPHGGMEMIWRNAIKCSIAGIANDDFFVTIIIILRLQARRDPALSMPLTRAYNGFTIDSGTPRCLSFAISPSRIAVPSPFVLIFIYGNAAAGIDSSTRVERASLCCVSFSTRAVIILFHLDYFIAAHLPLNR